MGGVPGLCLARQTMIEFAIYEKLMICGEGLDDRDQHDVEDVGMTRADIEILFPKDKHAAARAREKGTSAASE